MGTIPLVFLIPTRPPSYIPSRPVAQYSSVHVRARDGPVHSRWRFDVACSSPLSPIARYLFHDSLS